MEALQAANRVRVARSALKRQLKAGDLDLVAAIADPPAELGSAALATVLRSGRAMGPRKSDRVLRRVRPAGVFPHSRLDQMSGKQRQLLIAAVQLTSPSAGRGR